MESLATDHGQRPFADAYEAALGRHRAGDDPFTVVRFLSGSIDRVIGGLFNEKLKEYLPHVALLAVGGYGRRELCPQSDIDLLVLRAKECPDEPIEQFVRILWDSGIEPGLAVRTIKECYAYMRADHTTATSVLESRLLEGNKVLFDDFRQFCVGRFRRRRAENFAREKLTLLRNSVEGPQRTIYVIEPHLKEGACGLRDVQRVLWIQNIRRQGGTLEALAEQRKFSREEVRRVRDAYGFFLRTRCELHFSNKVRQDILDRDSQLTVARNLGYGEGLGDRAAVERLMSDYYRHAARVRHFLRFYLETGTRGRLFLSKLSWRFLATRVGPFLSIYRDRLFLSEEPPPERLPQELLRIFEIAQTKDVRLSEALCEWIRRKVESSSADFAHSGAITISFVSILRKGRNVGRLLKTMRATGVLDRILPEFAALECRVSFDGHHQFTVDEHTLRTLGELDRIQSEEDYPEQEFVQVYREIKDRLPLRVALLLHDIGKALPGEHAVRGTEASVIICERLGLDDRVTEVVEFLVYRHLELFRVSERRDFNEAEVVETLAQVVETEDRLKMLYLLTYLDIVSVGPGTWTRWKGAQLSELYQRTLVRLRTGRLDENRIEAVVASTALSDSQRSQLVRHCEKLQTPGYVREVLPERMLEHVSMVEAFQLNAETQVALEDFVGYQELTFCGRDRTSFFADLAGLLFSEGLSVLSARIFSRVDGVALDLFGVEVADTVNIQPEERLMRVRSKLRALERKEKSVEDFVRGRARSYRLGRWRQPLFGPSVTIDNETSTLYTIIEVSAGDRPGLLHDLAVGLNRLHLDVRMAKVSTLAERAHDVFYVTERNRSKVTNPTRLADIRAGLVTLAKQTRSDPWRLG